MTEAQWLWEYIGLKQKEDDDFELIQSLFKAFRTTLIKLLGLDLIKVTMEDEELEGKEDEDIFLPLALIAGRREFAQIILEKLDEKKNIKDALDDDEFEKISAAIASGEIGDMDPILDTSDVDEILSWQGPVKKQELEKLGIKIVEGDRKPMHHISLDIPEIKERSKNLKEVYQRASMDIESQNEQFKQRKNKMKVTFDDG